MTQFDLTDDQLQIQEMARKFTADAITPFAAEWDEKHIFPRDTIREAAELGFGSIYVSEESGGIGLGRLDAALIFEAMSYGCPSTSAFISIHNMASWMIDRFGGQEVKQKYLPSMITMEKIGSYCLTEPSSGSDAAALKTKAVLDGDHYVVSGSKAFISGGGENEVYVTMVRTGEDGPRGIAQFRGADRCCEIGVEKLPRRAILIGIVAKPVGCRGDQIDAGLESRKSRH